MAATHHHSDAAGAMGWLGRGLFCLVPYLGLTLLAWVLFGADWGGWFRGMPLPPDLPWSYSRPWAPDLGVDWTIRLDGLAALMLLLITGVGLAVFVYAGGYMAGHPQQGRLYILLTLFFGAMAGCVLADNLILLFVFWELTSLTSFLLVGFNHETTASRKSAQQALIVTGTGGLAMLAGILILGREFGTYSISQILPMLAAGPSPALLTALILILVGCFTKSAQFPFHFWLPNAMSAPTPVSAYLHSATMVKLGVYLLARLDPGFGEWPVWTVVLQTVGSVTAAWAMVLAIGERDLKRILAWSTVATLGTLVMLIGVPGGYAAPAVASLLLAHALYKAPLFFVAGNIDHGTGTRIIDRLGNLRSKMPWTALAASLAGFSMAGVPLTFGFVAKEAAMGAKESMGVLGFVPLANTLFSGVAVAVAATAAIRVFWPRPGRTEGCDAHEGNWAMVLPPVVLAVFGILLGVRPQIAEDLVLSAAASMVPSSVFLATTLDLSMVSILSSLGMTLGLGVVIFALWDPLHRQMDRAAAWLNKHGTAAQYENFIAAIPVVASYSTRWIQTGRLPGYLTWVLAGAIVGVGAALLPGLSGLPVPAWESPSVAATLACGLVILGALLACVLQERLVLLLASGLVGYGSAMLFLFTGAPDLAFTQFSVETLFVVVISAVLLQLIRARQSRPVPEPRWRPGSALVAVGFGVMMTGLMVVSLAAPLPMALTDFFNANSLPGAQGRNVVNVIIVDFRGLDTMGEITVVLLSLLAAVPVLGLLVRRPSQPSGRGDQP